MAEIEKTLVTIGINYICDNERCKGEVLPSGITGNLDSSLHPDNKDIVLYQHRCNKCDKVYIFKCHYPKIEYI